MSRRSVPPPPVPAIHVDASDATSTSSVEKERRSPSPRPVPPPPSAPLSPRGSVSKRPTRPLPPPPAPSPVAPSKEVKKPSAGDKRGYVCMEIITTEEAYLEQLQSLVNCYRKPLREAGVLSDERDRSIFSNIDTLVNIHVELLATLRAKLEGRTKADSAYAVGAALSSISPALVMYMEYVNRFHEGGEELRRLSKQRKFAKALAACKHGNLAGLTGLETLRVVPVQRVPRYVLLLREVLKCTDDDHPDRAACTKAMSDMENVAHRINEKKREFEQTQRLAYIQQHLDGGNLGALRDTTKNVGGQPHSFESNFFGLPHPCDWCKETLMMQGYKCSRCSYIAHTACFKSVPSSCGDAIVDRSSTPQLIKAHRKIVLESTIDTRTTPMDRPGEYLTTPFEPRTVLLCSDSLIVLRPEEEGTRWSVVDRVSFSTSVKEDLEPNVGPDLWSVAHIRTKLLHTFRQSDAAEKTKWVQACEATMEAWRAHVRESEEEEAAVTQKLSGLSFHISGTVPVASALERPFTVYIIQMRNERGTLTILKRYRQLLALHHALVNIYGESALPKFPAKKLIGNTSEAFLQKRARELSAYLDGIVKLKDILKVPEVRQFLTTTVSAKNEDELLPTFAPARTSSQLDAIHSLIEDSDEGEEVIQVSGDGDEEAPSPEMPLHTSGPPRLPRAIVLFAYDGAEMGSLVLLAGEELEVISRESAESSWCWARRVRDGAEGWCPCNYIHDERVDE